MRPSVLFSRVAVVALALCAIPAPWNDLASLTERSFFSDGATYYAMGHSLAHDFNLEYEARDLARTRRDYPGGPQGIFLKRASGGFTFQGRVTSEEPRLYFGKAMTYPILASPFVALWGTRGFLVFNVLCLLAGWFFAWRLCASGHEATMPALIVSAAMVFATVTPIYVFWIQPEVMNFALITAALLCGQTKRPALAALLFGVAAYTKPTHVVMALPFILGPLIATETGLGRRVAETVRRGVMVVVIAALGFLLNAGVTGEWNYQGGERKTFGGLYPFDQTREREVTFGNSGEWMTTMKLGPRSQGSESAPGQKGIGLGIEQAPEELSQMFRANLLYVWFGRYAGLFPYFAPAFLTLIVFLVIGPRTGRREAVGWLGVASLLLYFWLSIALLPGPTNWYGGGGALGNRYFTSALPLALLFVPKGREGLITVLGTVLSALFLAPAWASPVLHSVRPARLAARSSTLALLPAERSMLNDLALCTDAWRKKQAYDDVEGDAPLHRPGSRHGYWLYFPDDGTFGKEPLPGLTLWDGEPAEGFRVRRGRTTEILVRANEPVDWIDVTLRAQSVSDEIVIDTGRASETRSVTPGADVTFSIQPGSSLMYYDSFVYSVRVTSRASRGDSFDDKTSTLVRFALHVSPRPTR